jgi:superfamily II DNA or RNA helicase
MSVINNRQYQVESIQSLRNGFKEGHVRQVLAAPTGAGKSVIMLDMIRKAVDKGSRVMFICERRILVEQFSKHLDAAGIGHGVLMAKHWRFRPYELVQVASAQTLEKMESLPAFDICFVDELHAALRASIINLITTRPTLKIIGATATPFNPKIATHFSKVTCVTTMRQLVDDGYLVPFRVFVAREIDTKGLKVVAGEWQKDELEKRGQQIVGDVVADYVRISNEVFGGYRKTICFSCGIAHGADLAKKFNEVGINAVQISSNDDEEYRAEVLSDFAKPDSDIKVVISVAILSRGFDQSDVDYVILARPLKKSFSEHVQMVGRGARIHPEKKLCVIQDNSGNWLRFQDSWETLYNDGVTELTGEQDKKSRKEPSDKEKKEAKCPKCAVVWVGNTDVCSHCGHVRERKNDVVAVAGEMFELGQSVKKEKYSSQYKEDWYHSMIGLLRKNNKNENRAYYLYCEKFGVSPAWKKTAGIPTEDVIGYLKRSNIASAKRKYK